jgi:thioredoxin 1
MALQFTDENVNEYIASSRPTLVDCWATWCGPCMRMSPIIDEVAEEFGDKAAIGKYNVDEESDLSQQYRIMSIPTLLFFKDGKLVDRLAGSQSKATLVEKLNALL